MTPDVDVYDRVAGLVEQVLAAPGSPEAWKQMLAELCAQISDGAVALVLGRVGPAAYLLGHGVDMQRIAPDVLLPTADHPSGAEVPVGAVFAIPSASPMFAQTQLFQKILLREGVAPGPGLCAVLGRDARQITGALLVLSRDPRWSPRKEDRQLLKLLTPYLMRGVALGLRLNERRAGVEALLGSLDALALGVLLLDEQGEISFANRSAAELIGLATGARPPGEPVGRPPTRLEVALRSLGRRAKGSRGGFAIPHPEDGRPLHVVAAPLDWSGQREEVSRFATALFLGDPGHVPLPSRHALAELYDLTPSEERLVLALSEGAKLGEAAARLGIRLSTARSVLRSVFAKTGTHRQPSLVRLVLLTAGQLRLSS